MVPLDEEVATMPTDPAPTAALVRALACVFVTDFDRAIAFYRDVLGFDVAYTYGEPPFWAEVRGDAVAFNLRHVDRSPFLGGIRDDEQLLSVAITTSDATVLYERYDARGVDFHERLREKPWDAIEFVVRDPDGNLVLFGSPTNPG
jgi:catechol 2,3-dioxygenase-like lactoylglutathione lyase family enzyme